MNLRRRRKNDSDRDQSQDTHQVSQTPPRMRPEGSSDGTDSSSGNDTEQQPVLDRAFHPTPQISPRRTPHMNVKGQESIEVERTLIEQFTHLEQLQASSASLGASVTKELEKIHHEVQLMKQACVTRIQQFDRTFQQPYYHEASAKGDKSTFIPAKKFIPRESRLNIMLRIKDFSTLYNIFVAILPVLMTSICIQDYMQKGQFVDFSLFSSAFGKLHLVVPVWGVMYMTAMVAYGFKVLVKRLWFPVLAAVYVAFQALLCVYATYACLSLGLPVASSLIVVCEQVRLFMKIHSFVREHLPTNGVDAEKVYAEKHGGPMLKDVGFGQYMYFLACPSLLYRTEYPMAPSVRWTRVLIHALECTFVVLYLYILFVKFLFPLIWIPPTADAGSGGVVELVLIMFNSMVPSLIVCVFGFFGFLHCWLNMWAEMLQFADREFYRDWWNSLSFAEYYRKWNGVVYDWLYAYVYSDILLLLLRRGFTQKPARIMAAWFVIEFSALFHEYIIGVSIGFFYPVLLVVYGGPGVFFTLLARKNKHANLFVWAMLLVGMGLLITLYSREFYLRRHFVREYSIHQWEYWSQFFSVYSLSYLLGQSHSSSSAEL